MTLPRRSLRWSGHSAIIDGRFRLFARQLEERNPPSDTLGAILAVLAGGVVASELLSAEPELPP